MKVRTAPRATALLLDLLARLPPGPVFMPVNVCRLVPWAVRVTGHAAVFHDIDPVSLAVQVDPTDAPAPLAILYVRPYGAELPRRHVFARWRTLWPHTLIIDDACLGPPELEDAGCDPSADVTLFSTGRSKSVSVDGGGYGWCSERAEQCLSATPRVEWQGSLRTDSRQWTPAGWIEDEVDPGAPSPPWPVYAAAIRRAAESAATHRDVLNAIYRRAFPARGCLPPPYQRWRFHVGVEDPPAALAALERHQQFASRHFEPLVADRTRFKHAWSLYDRLINLFSDRQYSVAQAARTCEILKPYVVAIR